MPDETRSDPGPALDADERAAVRAYLQRSEVRLSTLHRVATALLSGAGLVVLLPAIERDSVVVVIRSLLTDTDLVDGLLAAAMVAVLALPLAALWLLLRDLTRFYFHGQHLRHDGTELFIPRFTLTGLRLPAGELHGGSPASLRVARDDPAAVELLVPSNQSTRRRIDRQLDAYALGAATDDHGRAAGLFELVASRERTLLDEVAKVEHGMARHVLRLQVIVLRYVKALLAFLTTAIAVFAAAAVVDGAGVIGAPEQAWLAAVVLTWAPCTIVAVGSPVRWLEQLLRSEGATRPSVSRDPEMTQVERIAVRIAVVAWLLAAVGGIAALAGGDVSAGGTVAGAVLGVVTAAAMGVTLGRALGWPTRW